MAAIALEEPEAQIGEREKLAVIDCDIHNTIEGGEIWAKYMPVKWLTLQNATGYRGRTGQNYPLGVPFAARNDAWPPSGNRPGSDLEFMQEQLLDEYDMDYGVLNCLVGAGGQQNLELGAAMARAINDWQIAEWLEPEPRLRASLVVSYEDADLAVKEINRLGDHPGYVQVLLATRTMEPMGRRKYWKIYEAAQDHNLAIAVHFGGQGVGPITGGGKPSHYIEDHAGMAQGFQAQVTSLVYEGVFEQFPGLNIVLIEGGFAWFPALMWRMDSCYKKLKSELPQLKRLPSEYVRDHFYTSTQPMEEPPDPAYLEEMLEHMDMNDKIMFATDYPHWDFDSPSRAIPTSLDKGFRRDIMAENARRLYGLE